MTDAIGLFIAASLVPILSIGFFLPLVVFCGLPLYSGGCFAAGWIYRSQLFERVHRNEQRIPSSKWREKRIHAAEMDGVISASPANAA